MSVTLDRSQMYRGGQGGHGGPMNQMASDPSRGQTRQMTHDPLDGKTHILYIMYTRDANGIEQLDPNCAEAEYYGSRTKSVVVQDAMKLTERPPWLTVIPTLIAIREGRGNRGNDSANELRALYEKQEEIQTVGIAKPLERDANGFPAFAGLGSSMTNSAMLTVGSIVGINQDPSRYQDGKMNGSSTSQAIQTLMERRQQQRAFTNRAF
jgi:hypothetical protein